jgi:hypothetical protein
MNRVSRPNTAAFAFVLALALATTGCADDRQSERAPGAPGGQTVGEVEPSPPERMAPNLVVTVLRCDRDGDSLRTTGSIRNQGQEDVRYVDVTLSWADSTGTPVATDVASIVQGETIMSGDSVVFDVATAHPQATECADARIFFYEPIP